MVLINGKVMFKQEWDYYHSYKPAWFQRVLWLFWPTMFYRNWCDYHLLDREDCEVGYVKNTEGKLEKFDTSNNKQRNAISK